jgi:hypothetical protein
MRSAPRCGHHEKAHDETKDEPVKLTTTTQVSVDGVMQGPGGPDENRSGGSERGGWARPSKPLFDNEAMAFVCEVYQRAGAFLFGRRTYELFAGYWGVREDLGHPIVSGPDIALDLVDSRAVPKDVTIQGLPAGRAPALCNRHGRPGAVT